MRKVAPIVGIAVALASASPARAATVQVNGGTLTLTVAQNELSPDQVRRYDYGPQFAQDPSYEIFGTGVVAGPGCTQYPGQVWCYDSGNITAFAAQLGNMNDTLKLTANTQNIEVPFPVPVTMSGGGGNDSLYGSTAAPNVIDGGPGADSLSGGSAADRLSLGAGGGSGSGNAGDDVMTGGPDGTNILSGGPGDDTLQAGAARVDENGDDGDDVLNGSPAGDFLDGGAGADRVIAGAGDDFIVDDRGSDTIDAGAGDDRIEARDHEVDTIACGPGHDHVQADRTDHVGSDCEIPPRFRFSGMGSHGMTTFGKLSRFSRTVKVRIDAVRCLPLHFPSACVPGESRRSWAHLRFKAKKGSVHRFHLKIPRRALPHLRQVHRHTRDIWLWVRVRDSAGLKAQTGTRLKLTPSA